MGSRKLFIPYSAPGIFRVIVRKRTLRKATPEGWAQDSVMSMATIFSSKAWSHTLNELFSSLEADATQSTIITLTSSTLYIPVGDLDARQVVSVFFDARK